MTATKTAVTIEIAVQSVGDALVADGAGADRLEFSSALELGGLTPSTAALLELRRVYHGPIVGMARPRAGGFCYDEGEFDALLRDAVGLIELGVDAVAFGVLLDDGRVDVRRCEIVRKATEGVELVFHRAFDLTPDADAALDAMVDLGIARVLTSGGQRAVAPPSGGAEVVARLIKRAAGRIVVVPAGGVRASNVAALIAATGCTQVHSACTRTMRDPSAAKPHDAYGFGAGGDDGAYLRVDAEKVGELLRAVDGRGA